MKKHTRFVGLDVHAATIAVAIAEGGRDGEVRSLGTIPNRAESVRKLMKKLWADCEELRVCYEAGPCGYALYWQLAEFGVECTVIAPTLVPKKAGDRVKTDRRDAEKLARCFRSGDLTAVWVPDKAHEALRDLVRARLAAKKDQLRARHRLSKFLLRLGRHASEGVKAWSAKYMAWLKTLKFDHAPQEAAFIDYSNEIEHARERVARLEKAIDVAVETAPESLRAVISGLQALRGVAKLTAVTAAVEVGTFSRFAHPRELMGYSGAVPSEYSSGGSTRRGSITHAGNSHLRRVILEAAWAYRFRPAVTGKLRQRQQGLSAEVTEISLKAQHRLHERYVRLLAKGKLKQKVVTAIGRELLGFMWAIGMQVEKELRDRKPMQQRLAA